MHKSFVAFFIFFMFSFGLLSQNTTITGYAHGAEGLKIRLITPSDYISELSEIIDETTIDSLGSFNLKTSINETRLAQLQIDNYKGEIYLEPGSSYSIKILPLNFKEDVKESPFLNRKRLEIEFVDADTNELNQQISKFNELYNDFLLKNFNTLNNSRNKAKIDSLQHKLAILFSTNQNTFLNKYILYKIAELEQMSRVKSTKRLYADYILNQPVMFNHVEYMYFFHQLYEKFFFNGTHALKTEDIKQLIIEKDYNSLMDSLGKDSLVRNEVIRELVFLKGMKELYYTNAYNNEHIVDMLISFSRTTKFKEHKLIALNLVTSFNILKVGNKAPDFKLKTINDETYTLASFAGKYTYIGFFTTWCAACMAENEAIVELKKKYGEHINFVSISADKQILNLKYYLEKQKYGWIFLHYGNNYDLLEKFGIFTYPVFMLLDANGNIVSNPALKPSENIDNEFKVLLKKENTISE